MEFSLADVDGLVWEFSSFSCGFIWPFSSSREERVFISAIPLPYISLALGSANRAICCRWRERWLLRLADCFKQRLHLPLIAREGLRNMSFSDDDCLEFISVSCLMFHVSKKVWLGLIVWMTLYIAEPSGSVLLHFMLVPTTITLKEVVRQVTA